MQPVRRSFGPSFRIFVLIGVLLVGLGLLARFGGGQIVGWVSQPLSAVGDWVERRFEPSQNAETVASERDRLREELLAVSQRLTETQRQLETIQTVEQLQDFFGDQALESILASVIAYSPDPGIQSIVIQRGSKDGVAVGQAVVSEHGVVIGIITRTDPATAIVRLITDSQSQLLSKIQNDQESRGIVRGERGLSITMQFIPRNDKVLEGQAVVTSGLDPDIPPDLLIGTIQETTERPGELFQSAMIRSPIEFQQLRAVAVVKPRL